MSLASTWPVIAKPALVFLGSGVGGLARYSLGGLIHSRVGTGFPLGTLVVNISGCFAIGVLATMIDGPLIAAAAKDHWRAALLVGVLGGFTTFSAFGRETFQLLSRGEHARAAAYVALSLFVSLLAVWLGALVGGRFAGTQA